MASTSSAPTVASLPAKKRKASNASHASTNSNQGSSNCSIQPQPTATTTATTTATSTATSTTTTEQQVQEEEEEEGHSSSKLDSKIGQPSKIRKGSTDGSMAESCAAPIIPGPVADAEPSFTVNKQMGSEESQTKLPNECSKVLPCKKRKGSQDSSLGSKPKPTQEGADSFSISDAAALKNPCRKESQDSSSLAVSLGDDILRQRKGSQDSSLSFEWATGRKSSDATTSVNLKFDDDILLRTSDVGLGDLKLEATIATATLLPLVENPALELASAAAAIDHLEALGSADHDDTTEHILLIDTASGPVGSATTSSDPKVTGSERKESDADYHSYGSGATFASSGHRLLLEAIMMTSTNPGTTSTTHNSKSNLCGNNEPSSSASNMATGLAESTNHVTTRERLESWGLASTTNRERLESWGCLSQHSSARNRFESWGGMSDLSLPHVGLLLEEEMKHGVSNKPAASSTVPSRISLERERERLNSVASLSEVSVNLPFLFDASSLDGLGGVGSSGGLGSASVGSGILVHASDLQAYVAAAVASVGDQLAELAGAVENAASGADDVLDLFKRGHESETSSVSSPLIGAFSDGRHGAGAERVSNGAGPSAGRPRSWSTSSGRISVDFEAVQAAIDAAQAASDALEISTVAENLDTAESTSTSVPAPSTKKKYRATSRRKLPITRRERSRRSKSPSSVENQGKECGASLCDTEADQIRERTKAVAGYKRPPASAKAASALADPCKTAPPLKKRARRSSPIEVTLSQQMGSAQTPVVSNRAVLEPPYDTPMFPSSSIDIPELGANSAQGPSNKKWEMMFSALVDFADERREEETKNMSEEEKSRWIWDGNVPTTFKTKDGKPLGRWVNNQRSAKSKGTLKEDREERLIGAGLKWSVLNSNTWNDMLEELRIYIEEQTKQGQKWDGNVPTNYQIRSRPGSQYQGEDRNLGRWVNRQRSLFQAGRLRKDRQHMLEQIGLKWSMLATISWDSMFESLVAYVEKNKKSGCEWDGNVPANYRTDDNPPRALGRWINRQRSAFVKNRLKDEYKEKLTTIGLKWSVHFRGSRDSNDFDPDYDSDASDEEKATTEMEKSNTETEKATAETEKATTETKKATTETEKATTVTEKATTVTEKATTVTEKAFTETEKAFTEMEKATTVTEKATTEMEKATTVTEKPATTEMVKATTETEKVVPLECPSHVALL